MINPDDHSFFLSPTQPDEIEKIIDKLNPSKSTGPNGIPVFILKLFKGFSHSGYQSWLICALWISSYVEISQSYPPAQKR